MWIEAGGARIVRRRVRRGFELEQGHAAGAEPRGLCVAVDDVQADRVGIEIGEAREIARLQPDRADAQRRAVGEGHGGGGVRGVHGAAFRCRSLYWGAPSAGQPGRGGGVARTTRAGAQAAAGPLRRVGAVRASANPYAEQPEVCMSVDTATVRRIAHLARIAVADDEVEHLKGELNAMLAFVEQLQEVNVDGRRADDLGDADGDEEARGRGDRRRHRGRHREERAGDARITSSSCRRWWNSRCAGPARKASASASGRWSTSFRTGTDAGRAHGGGPAHHGPAAAGRALPRGTARRHDPDPAGRAVRTREEEDRAEEQFRLRQPGPE